MSGHRYFGNSFAARDGREWTGRYVCDRCGDGTVRGGRCRCGGFRQPLYRRKPEDVAVETGEMLSDVYRNIRESKGDT